jgi:hypothetical protein
VAALAFLAFDTGPAHAPDDGGQRAPTSSTPQEWHSLEASFQRATDAVPTDRSVQPCPTAHLDPLATPASPSGPSLHAVLSPQRAYLGFE